MGVIMPAAERLVVAEQTRISGPEFVAKRIGISTTTLLRALAGCPIYPGSLSIIRRALNIEPTPEQP
jgi:hypothetical protein